jgi:hypothetical protein
MKHDDFTMLNTLIKRVINIGKRQNSDVSETVLFSRSSVVGVMNDKYKYDIAISYVTDACLNLGS